MELLQFLKSPNEEYGITGRPYHCWKGLEVVCRHCEVRQRKKDAMPKRSLLDLLDLHDIIEAGRQLEWADGSRPVLTQAAASLLHHLRSWFRCRRSTSDFVFDSAVPNGVQKARFNQRVSVFCLRLPARAKQVLQPGGHYELKSLAANLI